MHKESWNKSYNNIKRTEKKKNRCPYLLSTIACATILFTFVEPSSMFLQRSLDLYKDLTKDMHEMYIKPTLNLQLNRFHYGCGTYWRKHEDKRSHIEQLQDNMVGKCFYYRFKRNSNKPPMIKIKLVWMQTLNFQLLDIMSQYGSSLHEF